MIAVAASHLPNGKILLWSGEKTNHWGEVGTSLVSVWDPFATTTNTTTSSSSMTLERMRVNHHNMFCPGTTHLADGRIMITGGMDNWKTTFYDPVYDQWTAGPNMNINRGYQSQTMLQNGDVFVIGGSWLAFEECMGNKHGELWSARTNTWRLLPKVPVDPFLTQDVEGAYRTDNHMWLFLAPSGDRIFHAGPSTQMHWITTEGEGSVTPSLQRGAYDAMNGNAVLYDIGKILVVGGAPNYDNGTALDTAFLIDINGPGEATVVQTESMSTRRTFANSIVLPNGEVVTMGGTEEAHIFSDYLSVLHAELWSPVTQRWTQLEAMQSPRNYHSSALLLKDGRIMSGGGGLCACEADHQDIEILTPPYLYEYYTGGGGEQQRGGGRRQLAMRPEILHTTVQTAAPGDTLDIIMDTPDAGHTFALIKHSTYTHSTNNDQRRIPLPVIVRRPETSTFTVQIPANKNAVLAGMYFLFAMNGEGVPSIAEDFRIVV